MPKSESKKSLKKSGKSENSKEGILFNPEEFRKLMQKNAKKLGIAEDLELEKMYKLMLKLATGKDLNSPDCDEGLSKMEEEEYYSSLNAEEKKFYNGLSREEKNWYLDNASIKSELEKIEHQYNKRNQDLEKFKTLINEDSKNKKQLLSQIISLSRLSNIFNI